ncbi:DOMON domain protein [Candidatus Desulfarcum epimagneticum]|uniref:DOMON domain protein n=1 Tax=uncultured Desulfobacteraceae bacterium TaxID=218296 RepID=A0A484HFT2_9BACT|nr:DOMON domain protein [uncultured Desulfobacteraceae bacterium]
MKRYIMAATAAVFWLASLAPAMADAGYDHEISGDPVRFQWKLNPDKKTIQIRLSAQTKSWVAVGFNPDQRMQGADFVMGYVKKGKVKVTDHFGTGVFVHKKDESLGGAMNVFDVSGKEAGGVTEISFSRPLDSGDAYDKPIVPDRETTLLLAYGAGRDSFRAAHAFRAVYKVSLSTGAFKKVR